MWLGARCGRPAGQQVSDLLSDESSPAEAMELFVGQWGATWAAENHGPVPSPPGDTLGRRSCFPSLASSANSTAA